MNKVLAFAAFLLFVSFVTAWYGYNEVPGERIASHWNAEGEVDDHMDKFWGLFLFPFIAAFLFLLFLVIPRIDPLKKNIEEFRSYYDWFVVILLVFFLYIQSLVVLWNIDPLQYSFNMAIAIMPPMALLFYYLGILMKHSKRNWFIGIRTPWTLSSDEVWDKTHDVGGKLFKALAAYIILLMAFEYQIKTFFLWGLWMPKEQVGSYFVWLFTLPMLVVALGLVVYSYWLYTKIKKSTLKSRKRDS